MKRFESHSVWPSTSMRWMQMIADDPNVYEALGVESRQTNFRRN